MPGNHFDGSLQEIFDVFTPSKDRSKFTHITKQIEMMPVFSIHDEYFRNFLYPPKADWATNINHQIDGNKIVAYLTGATIVKISVKA